MALNLKLLSHKTKRVKKICSKCNNKGHFDNECLIYPEKINESFIKLNNMKCFTCGSNQHVICDNSKKDLSPYQIEGYFSDEVEVSEDEDNEIMKRKVLKKEMNVERNLKKKHKRVFLNFPNEDIHKKLFCYKCGGVHLADFCMMKGNNDYYVSRKKNILEKFMNYCKQENKKKELLKKQAKLISKLNSGLNQNLYNKIIA